MPMKSQQSIQPQKHAKIHEFKKIRKHGLHH